MTINATRREMVGLVGSLASYQVAGAARSDSNDVTRTPAELAAGVSPTNPQHPELDPRRYGADPAGKDDSQPAIAAALAVAEQFANTIIRFPTGGLFRCDRGLIIDANKVGIDFQGATLSFTRMTSGNAIAFTQSEMDVNQRPLRNSTHPIMNGRLVGPGVESGVGCVFLSDRTGNLPAIKFKNVAIENFSTDVIFSAGAYCTSFDSCSFTQTAGSRSSSYSITISESNNGERNVFTDCFWFNRAFQIDARSPNSDTYFTNCSFDSFVTAVKVTAGMVFLSGCHIEGSLDIAEWGKVSTGGTLFICDTTIIAQVDKTSFDIFTSAKGNSNGGIFLDRIFLTFGNHLMTTRLIGGSGNAKASNIVQPRYSNRAVIGEALNLLAYGGFEEEQYANDWLLAGTTPPSRTRSQARSGSWSLQILGDSATSSNPAVATARRPCTVGQRIQGELWVRFTNTEGSGASFNYSVRYLDAAGDPIGSSGAANSITNGATSWTRLLLSTVDPAPPGTVSAAVALTVTSTKNGTAAAYIDDVVLNVF